MSWTSCIKIDYCGRFKRSSWFIFSDSGRRLSETTLSRVTVEAFESKTQTSEKHVAVIHFKLAHWASSKHRSWRQTYILGVPRSGDDEASMNGLKNDNVTKYIHTFFQLLTSSSTDSLQTLHSDKFQCHKHAPEQRSAPDLFAPDIK